MLRAVCDRQHKKPGTKPLPCIWASDLGEAIVDYKTAIVRLDSKGAVIYAGCMREHYPYYADH